MSNKWSNDAWETSTELFVFPLFGNIQWVALHHSLVYITDKQAPTTGCSMLCFLFKPFLSTMAGSKTMSAHRWICISRHLLRCTQKYCCIKYWEGLNFTQRLARAQNAFWWISTHRMKIELLNSKTGQRPTANCFMAHTFFCGHGPTWYIYNS